MYMVIYFITQLLHHSVTIIFTTVSLTGMNIRC